jgi:hypothetical protein
MLPTKFNFIWLRGVSEEKIKMWKRTTDGRRQVMAKAHIAFGKVS